MPSSWIFSHRRWWRVAAAVVAVGVCFLGGRGGPAITTSEIALVLVLVVVGAAAPGDRWAGIIAALVGAVSFDFFLIPPLYDLHMTNPDNIALAVVLLLVGLAVSELALWGGRHKAVSSRRQGYLQGALAITDLTAAGATREQTAQVVATKLREVLGVEQVTYVASPPEKSSAVLERDGRLTVGDRVLDVRADGLPTDRFIAVPVEQSDGSPGHFRISAATAVVRVRAEQLRVAVLLADEFSSSERARVGV